jgi:antitoxin component YwqK of YwqJK toxin-antitoxin module
MMKILLAILMVLVVLSLLVPGCDELFTDSNTGPSSQSSPSSQSPPASKVSTSLSGADRDLYQQVVQILGSDPEYNKLGYTSEQFQYLVTQADCLSLALKIRKPGVDSRGILLNLGRPQLEAVVQVKDLEGYRGNLMEELSSRAELNEKLNNLFGYIKDFYKALGEGSMWGIFKTFVSIGSDKIKTSIQKELTNYSFNHLYTGYKAGRDASPSKTHGSGIDAVTVHWGPYFDDYNNVTLFYMDLKDKAKLEWDSEVINQMVGQYLDQRYRTENGMPMDSWLVPVTNPRQAMENALRHDSHLLKMHLKKVLQDFTKPCVDEMPKDSTTSNKSEIKTRTVYFEGTQNIKHKYTYYLLNGKEYPDGTWTTYYSTGKVEYQNNWKDGKPEGLQQHYTSDGNLEWEYYTKGGLKDGLSRTYHSNGKLYQEKNFKNDKQDGSDKTYYPNGTLWEEVMWKDGQKVTGTYKYYDEKGKLIKSG